MCPKGKFKKGAILDWIIDFNFFSPNYLAFNLLGLKKYHSHKISSKQHLKKLVVENFLNVLSVSAIILLMTAVTVGIADHLR